MITNIMEEERSIAPAQEKEGKSSLQPKVQSEEHVAVAMKSIKRTSPNAGYNQYHTS
jgi:hypothetical protein